MKPWKAEHVELLRQKIEELRHVSLIDDTGSNENMDTTSTKGSEEKIDDGGEKLSKSVPKKRKGPKNPDISDTGKKQKQVSNRKTYTLQFFKPEEDKILLKAMRSGEDIDYNKFAKKLNRDHASIRDRVKKLEMTGVSTKTSKRFTLEEDLKVIDSALKNLKEFSKLDDTPLKDVQDLSLSLKRNVSSLKQRWDRRLKVWLKSYYTKTLNLDIRIMLAEVLADNFEDIDSIDWNLVSSFKEFSGHTVTSLKSTFFAYILYNTSKLHCKEDKTKLTLREIANDAAVTYSKENAGKVTDATLKRQRDVIDYFEKKVKKLGIKDFV